MSGGPPDRPLEVREQGVPADPVPVAPRTGLVGEPLPAALLDLDPRRARTRGDEADLDIGRLLGRATDVPGVGEAAGRVPGRDPAPVVLGAVGLQLVDASA